MAATGGAPETAALRADVRAYIDQLASGEADTPENMAPDEARLLYRQMCEVNEPPRGPLERVVDLGIGCRDGARIGARLYVPPESGDAPSAVILFFHGGGWVLGDLDTHDSLCSALARGMGLRVVAVDYRRAPEHAFPTANHDALDAMAWLAAGPDGLGAPVDGIILAGDSAGAMLAACCAQAAATAGSPLILALASFYGSFDANATGGSMAAYAEGYLLTAEMMAGFLLAYFRSAADRASPLASPLGWDGFDQHPPALIFACEYDPLRDQSRAYAARLAAHGVPVRYREAKGHIHGCVTLRTVIPSGQADLDACIADLGSLVAERRVQLGQLPAPAAAQRGPA